MGISAAQVKELREKTGAGMMDCKKALTENDGNIDAAVKFLREKGLAAAAKKAGRIAAEGLVGMSTEGKAAAIVEVNCETDFVAKNDDFQKLVKDLADHVAKNAAKDLDDLHGQSFGGGTVKDAITNAIATIGENISIRRFERYDDADLYGTYAHGGGTIGVLVALAANDSGKLDGSAEVLAKDLAMHVASEAPLGIRESDIAKSVIDNERDIYKAQALEQGKPENIVDKIVDGRIKKFLAESLLLEQQFIKDDIKVKKLVANVGKDIGTDLDVKAFARFKVGEGIEKKQDDLAAEVAKMTGAEAPSGGDEKKSESYYKVIDGKKYDREVLDLADTLTKGQGDGRLSKDDAAKLFDAVKDGDKYTDIEKDSIKYVRDNFKWTDAADEWFRTEVRKWAATK